MQFYSLAISADFFFAKLDFFPFPSKEKTYVWLS